MPFDRIAPAHQRYVEKRTGSEIEMWTCVHRRARIPAGKTLRVITGSAAIVRWSATGGAAGEVTATETALGLWFADLPTNKLPAGTQIEFRVTLRRKTRCGTPSRRHHLLKRMKPYLNPTKISLMLSDVDGTLVTDDKVVTPRARAAVAELRAAHIGFTITSARPPRGMKMLIDDLKIDTIVAGFNGGVFVKPDLTVIQSRFISRAVAALALEVIGQHELAAWIYTDTDWFVPDPNGAHVAREALTVKFEAKVSTRLRLSSGSSRVKSWA